MDKSVSYPILSTINSPADVRKLKKDQLKPLAKELREYLTHTVSISGGHFSAGLGTVELTVALHYVFDTHPTSWSGMSVIRRIRTRF